MRGLLSCSKAMPFVGLLKMMVYVCCSIFILTACRGDDEQLVPSTWTRVADANSEAVVKGFYLLNEGNMGSNKSTLDYFDYTSGYYRKNIYAETNPSVVMELGDVGNDLQCYGQKLYAIINCSHFVEVMNRSDAKHIGAINIPNCRYIVFSGRYAYVSSYAGPVKVDPNARLGYIAKVDTATLQVVDTCVVGYQPEEMAVVGGKLYVANSGGYRVPNYDRTISVVDLATFKETKKIDVAINLHRLRSDNYGYLWVSSRGDYYTVPSKLYVVDTRNDEVADSLNVSVSNMTLDDDNLYTISTEYSYTSGQEWTVSYAKINVRNRQVITHNFIEDGTEKAIKKPYGIGVNPKTKEIFVTDAKDYVSPGTLYCFSPEGRKKWSVRTGDIPAHFCFIDR